MRRKLTLFKENFIINKKELLYSLEKTKEYYVNPDNEEDLSEKKIEILLKRIDQFIKLVKQSELPKLDNWWYYQYDIGAFAIRLELCYCDEIEYDEFGCESSSSTSSMYELLSLEYNMLSIDEFANIHKVASSTVRRWIRTGKLRAVKKAGKHWFISELADLPTRKYNPVIYYWNKQISWSDEFSYLNGYYRVYIEQNRDKKNSLIFI